MLADVRKLTEVGLLKYASGDDLNDEDTKNLNSAKPLVEALVNFDPTGMGSISLKGKIHLALGETAEAETAFRQAIKNRGVSTNADVLRLTADLHNELGMMAHNKGQSEAARKEIEEAIKLAPTNLDYQCNLASVLIEAEKLDEAQKILDEVLAKNPEHARARDLTKLIGFARTPKN